jgi:hypothetical protein
MQLKFKASAGESEKFFLCMELKMLVKKEEILGCLKAVLSSLKKSFECVLLNSSAVIIVLSGNLMK